MAQIRSMLARQWLFVTIISCLLVASFAAAQVFLSSEAKAGEDADGARGKAEGPIEQVTLQMSPGGDSCLRGKALFVVEDVGFAIDLNNEADSRLYDLVLSAQEFGRPVRVVYAADESRKEWVAACDAFQSDRKYFKVRALSVQSAEFVPGTRRRARKGK